MAHKRELLVNRKPLRDRENVLSSDVADAIEQLVGPDASSLPRAFDKAAIIIKLVEIAHTDDDGALVKPTVAARRAMIEHYSNRVTNTAVFQAGYKRYEERAKFPIVPVTDFFFKHIYNNGVVAEVLDAMSDFEIMHSLPKRKGRVAVGNKEDGTTEFLRDSNGEVLVYGDLAGIIVFPPNSHAELLRAWLSRLTNLSGGLVNNVVDKIEHARPESVMVERMREIVQPVKPAMRQALPAPKRKR